VSFLEEGEIRRRLERHAAWHRCELTDGPLVLMTSPADNQAAKQLAAKHAPPEDAEGLRTWWTDPQTVVGRFAEQTELTNFYGDAWPSHFVDVGPDVGACCVGSRSTLRPATIWQEPLIENWSTMPPLVLHEDSFMWRACQAITQASVSAAAGRWVTTLTDIGGPMDTLACLRTAEKLCFDLIEHPAEVQQAQSALLKVWLQVYERLVPLVRARWGGTCGWNGLWHTGRSYITQCDFSCLIRREMFREFVLPNLQEQAASLDVTVYHLDGPGAIRHLDDLLTIPNLRAVQWIPGDGQSYDVSAWLDLYRKILDGDRGIQMHCPRPEELDLIFDKLDPDRIAVWLGTGGDAEKTMARVERLRAKRKRPR
jgi:hypothetical protein